jgi:Transposase IS116/IS110/IS902 family
VLLSIIGDVKDFADENKLASYFGIVPKVADSNQTERHGRITKRGSKLGRLVLVQCTLMAKRFSPYLQQYYERIKGRRGSGKALITTARKFLWIIYRTLNEGWMFSDFHPCIIPDGGVDAHWELTLILRAASATDEGLWQMLSNFHCLRREIMTRFECPCASPMEGGYKLPST